MAPDWCETLVVHSFRIVVSQPVFNNFVSLPVAAEAGSTLGSGLTRWH